MDYFYATDSKHAAIICSMVSDIVKLEKSLSLHSATTQCLDIRSTIDRKDTIIRFSSEKTLNHRLVAKVELSIQFV